MHGFSTDAAEAAAKRLVQILRGAVAVGTSSTHVHGNWRLLSLYAYMKIQYLLAG